MTVITIGGQVGAGAQEIGAIVASTLRIDYVERLASRAVAEQVNATPEAVWLKETTRPSGWRGRLAGLLERSLMNLGRYGSAEGSWGMPMLAAHEYLRLEEIQATSVRTSPHQIPDDEFDEAIQLVNDELASNGNVVLVKRGGCVTLRERDDILHIGLFALKDVRIARTANLLGVSPEVALETMEEREAAREAFFWRMLRAHPHETELYDAVIHVGSASESAIAADIVGMVDTRSQEEAEFPPAVSDDQFVGP